MKKLVLILFVFMSLGGFAQQDALFSQYMFNKLVLNPAYAGTRETISATIVGRRQWVGIDGGPETATFTVHGPLRNRKVGLGLYVYTDQLGPLVSYGIMTNYSYIIQVGQKGKLSFGLQAGIKHTDIDWNLISMPDDNDLIRNSQVKKKLVPDVNFGLYYYTDKFYVGLSSKHLIEEDFIVVETPDKDVYATLLRHFYGMAGVAIPLGDRLVIKPSTLVKYVKNAPVQVDLNLNLLINKVLWIGASYRTERTAVFLAELVVSQKLRIGYSYDVFLNELRQYNKGSHEIMLGYDFPLFKNRMLTPRYF